MTTEIGPDVAKVLAEAREALVETAEANHRGMELLVAMGGHHSEDPDASLLVYRVDQALAAFTADMPAAIGWFTSHVTHVHGCDFLKPSTVPRQCSCGYQAALTKLEKSNG